MGNVKEAPDHTGNEAIKDKQIGDSGQAQKEEIAICNYHCDCVTNSSPKDSNGG